MAEISLLWLINEDSDEIGEEENHDIMMIYCQIFCFFNKIILLLFFIITSRVIIWFNSHCFS